MWYAFWAISLALISCAIVWYATYRESLEENQGGRDKSLSPSSLKLLDKLGGGQPAQDAPKATREAKAATPKPASPSVKPKKTKASQGPRKPKPKS
ncbi:hypothetical protein [Candidatus Hepatobacter penaei]|uniref:hypothetical protein n=1 Tax=Candidatus Hepatobacter penaei TaxID=1274402 RepID=UPI0004F24006|nr:hypothetical protein [Candidatus Hepatobacter penaei]TGW15223.1 hypothetical protein EIL50_02625 [bacterium NHP-B]